MDNFQMLDLGRAKRVAKKEDWNTRMPEEDRAAKDEGEKLAEDTKDTDPLDIGAPDLWDDDEEDEPGTSDRKKIPNPKEGDLDSDCKDETGQGEFSYLREGLIEEKKQKGDLRRSVKNFLNVQRGDVTVLGQRRVQVDLSFLPTVQDRMRVKTIVETVIKSFSTIPGRVGTVVNSEDGIYTFSVTSNLLSPGSESSSTEAPSLPLTSRPLHRKKPSASLLINPYQQQFIEGIIFESKFPGLAPYVFKYGEGGVTDAVVNAALKVKPDAPMYELIEYILIGTGLDGRVKNFYKFPFTK